jgi:uncharacterized membrane protein
MNRAYRLSAVAATALLGLMAGFFFAFAVDVAPAMTRLDASAYVSTQQSINKAVRNLGFGAVYFGSALLPFAVAAVCAVCGRRGHALAWAGIALVYAGAVFWVTRSINVPINDALAQWNALAPPADWALLRDRWNEANTWRAIASCACFIAALTLATSPVRTAPGR